MVQREGPERNIVLITGGTRGIGKAIVGQALARDPLSMVVNFGNTALETVVRGILNGPHIHEYCHIGEPGRTEYAPNVDFTKGGLLEAALKTKLGQLSQGTHNKITGVVHCAGVSRLVWEGLRNADHNTPADEAEAAKRIMKQVNVDAALIIARVLQENFPQMLAPNARFSYVSSLAAQGMDVPGLEAYAASKDDALAGLEQIWTPELITKVYPGVFDTDMVRQFIGSGRTPFEFFAAPMAQARPNHPLSKSVAKLALGQSQASGISFPRLSRWYVKLANHKRQRTLLPWLVKLFGRSVLETIGQGKEEHDARVEWHGNAETYGPEFPYERMMYERLAPAAIGNCVAAAVRAMPFKIL
jgi:NAD(P)-dependent dehydrogenase (short-subunit alcohol dehydrogenase family)